MADFKELARLQPHPRPTASQSPGAIRDAVKRGLDAKAAARRKAILAEEAAKVPLKQEDLQRLKEADRQRGSDLMKALRGEK